MWSPDGMRLAFRRTSDESGIYVMSADGSDERRLTDTADIPESWSRDGRFLLTESLGMVTMLAVDGDQGEAVQVSSRNGRASNARFSAGRELHRLHIRRVGPPRSVRAGHASWTAAREALDRWGNQPAVAR